MSTAHVRQIEAPALRQLLDGDGEIALFDIREESTIRESHIFHAAYFPLSDPDRQARARALVPRLSTTVVFTGEEQDVLVEAERWASWGYTDVRVLHGGMDGWVAAGERTYRHVCGPSKALAEAGAVEFKTQAWTPDDLVRAQRDASTQYKPPPIVIDVRSPPEYARGSIPGALGLPGGEVLSRISSLVDSPDQPVVVTCAFRTRGQFGSTSLGWWGQLPNPVYFLQGGTTAWLKAGYSLEPGSTTTAPTPSQTNLWTHPYAHTVQYLHINDIEDFLNADRTTYIIDPRLEPGSVPPALRHLTVRHIPAGQYIEAIDEYTPVYRSRVVLIDDPPYSRAIPLALWLRASRLVEVYVLVSDDFGEKETSTTGYRRGIPNPPPGSRGGPRSDVPNSPPRCRSGIPPPDLPRPPARDCGSSLGLIPDYTEWSLALPEMARAELTGGFAFARGKRK